jgi:sugar phosphate isomerase/epimerase
VVAAASAQTTHSSDESPRTSSGHRRKIARLFSRRGFLRTAAVGAAGVAVAGTTGGGSFADPGQGLIEFARIFRAHAVDEYIVERDDAGSPPRAPEDALDTARVGYEFLRTVRF